MRIRDLLVLVIAATACVSNPDVRPRSVEAVVRDGHGGWIVITPHHGPEIAGELIAVDPADIRVLTQAGLVSISTLAVSKARLWAWQTQVGSIAAWGTLGTLSTLSHGYWLVFSAPVWLLSTAITAGVESYASVLDYPADSWTRFSVWARFPQGLPAGVTERDLVHQRRPPPGHEPASAPVSPGAPAPPAHPAPSAALAPNHPGLDFTRAAWARCFWSCERARISARGSALICPQAPPVRSSSSPPAAHASRAA